MSSPHTPSPDLFFDTAFAPQRNAALKTAIDLEVFTAIDDGAAKVSEIAARCGASERGIRILCDTLTTMGFLTKTAGRYGLTEDSTTFLSKRSAAYLGGTLEFLHMPELAQGFENLTETVRRGTIEASKDLIAPENPIWVRFARAMVPMMMPAVQAIPDILGTAANGPIRILDIAAGHGMFGIALAQRNPAAEVVAVDWPQVLSVATENAAAMGVAGRYRTLAGDAFTVDYASGFDVALLTNFLHHYDPTACVGLLRKVAAALKPGGRVVLLEFVPNEDRVTPTMAARFSLTMLAETAGGDAYTFRELRGMLAEAGFSDASAHPVPGPETVVVATK